MSGKIDEAKQAHAAKAESEKEPLDPASQALEEARAKVAAMDAEEAKEEK